MNDPEDPEPESIKNAVPAPPEAVPAIIDTLQSSSSSLLNSSVPSNLVKHQYSWQVHPILASSSIPTRNVIEQGSSPYKELHGNSFGLLPSLTKSLVAQLRTVYFDRVGAVAYAQKWWSGFNPKYRNFQQVFGLPFYNAGDCTNYASQILYEGGQWAMVGDYGSRTSDLAWWYNFDPTIPISAFADTQTYTWAAAVNFWRFLSKNPSRATPVNRSALLEPGDVVQVDFGKGEGVSHTMIVTYRRTDDGMIYLIGHTNPHYLLPIYDIQANFPNAKFYTWKLANSYTY